jgi:hypothetical protein
VCGESVERRENRERVCVEWSGREDSRLTSKVFLRCAYHCSSSVSVRASVEERRESEEEVKEEDFCTEEQVEEQEEEEENTSESPRRVVVQEEGEEEEDGEREEESVAVGAEDDEVSCFSEASAEEVGGRSIF